MSVGVTVKMGRRRVRGRVVGSRTVFIQDRTGIRVRMMVRVVVVIQSCCNNTSIFRSVALVVVMCYNNNSCSSSRTRAVVMLNRKVWRRNVRTPRMRRPPSAIFLV